MTAFIVVVQVLTAAVQTAIDALPFTIQMIVNAVACAVQAICPFFMTIGGGNMGTVVEAIIDAVTAVIQMPLNAVAAAI